MLFGRRKFAENAPGDERAAAGAGPIMQIMHLQHTDYTAAPDPQT